MLNPVFELAISIEQLANVAIINGRDLLIIIDFCQVFIFGGLFNI